MSYLIRQGKLVEAKGIKKLTSVQKKSFKMSTPKQSDKLKALKAKMEKQRAS